MENMIWKNLQERELNFCIIPVYNLAQKTMCLLNVPDCAIVSHPWGYFFFLSLSATSHFWRLALSFCGHTFMRGVSTVWVAAVCSIERQESNQLLECTAAARINHWKSPVLSAAAHLARLQYYRWMICTLRRIQTTPAMIDSLNRGGSVKLHRYSNLCFPSVVSARNITSRKS